MLSLLSKELITPTISVNNGTLDRLWKRHGRWVSDRAKDGYVADDLHKRLSVTLGLGL